jgi:multiple sugar transport system ATP-binding protein
MAQVTLRKVVKMYDEVQAVRGIDLDITDKEFIVLVGPSGCGKSTTLRMIAGLEEISGGDIAIGGDVVNDVPPKDRDIAMVFQNYALYPHMNVYENMSFGLKLKRTPKDEIDRRVKQAAQILDITELLDRKPKQLSGGQRQRVAMGRAIVRDPKVFLFDEPLSNLDAKLRVQMRTEIKRLRERVATTTIYVTHDQVEAMTLADRIVILNHGRIEQIGTPEDVYDRPASTFVAGFIGAPPMNLLPAAAFPFAGQLSDKLLLGVRPEHLVWANGNALIEGTALVVEPLGSDTLVSLEVAGTPLVARLPPRTVRRKGEAVRLTADPANLHFFDKATGIRQTT